MRHTTFRFALDPTPAQEQMLAWHAGASRFAYNECLRFVTNALDAKRKDRSVKVPWSGYDLINAFNAWKRGEEAGRVFVVSLNVHATDLHPGRGHQPCPEREAGRYVGVDVALSRSRSRQDPTEPRSGAGRPTIPCPAGFAGYSAVPAPCRERSAAPGTTERRQAAST